MKARCAPICMLLIAIAVLAALLPITQARADTKSSWNGLDEVGRNMIFYDDTFSPDPGETAWRYSPILSALCDPATACVLNWEFSEGTVDSTVAWQYTADVATHTKAVADSLGGILKLSAATTDNNEIYMYGRGEPVRFRADKPVLFDCRVRVLAVEDSTYADNVIVGLISAGGANTLQDAGAGPPADYSGAVFYIPDQPGTGSTYWHAESSTTTTQETTASVAARTAGTWYRLSILWDGNDAVYFFIDGTLEATHTTSYAADSVSLTPIVGCKTGAAATTTIEVDYIKILQVR